MKIALVPIDNRPVCFALAQQIAEINPELELVLPPRTMLGDLQREADIEGIFEWLKELTDVDKVVLSLDTIAYGGLIPSRRSEDTFEQIKERVDNLKNILSKKKAKIYAFSSIMRISNNNINEEEKEYWEQYGEKIFQYSFETHKNAPDGNVETDVPEEIIQDYLATRKRNFDINQYYLELTKPKKGALFDTLVFSKDDCAQYGFNVAEAQSLQTKIDEMKAKALIKTGADEIPLSLLSRALLSTTVKGDKKVKIVPYYMELNSKDKISKYEDVSVEDSIKGQIELAGAEVSGFEEADIIMIVNNFKEEQGELVMGVEVEGCTKDFNIEEMTHGKPYFVVDILNANGADNSFVEKLLGKNKFDWEKFLGYAGWNTTGNTLGSALCCALVKYSANISNLYCFKKVQMIRFLDDWAYQANVRKKLKSKLTNISVEDLKTEMEPYEKRLNDIFKEDFGTIVYAYPWSRFFEIKVVIH